MLGYSLKNQVPTIYGSMDKCRKSSPNRPYHFFLSEDINHTSNFTRDVLNLGLLIIHQSFEIMPPLPPHPGRKNARILTFLKAEPRQTPWTARTISWLKSFQQEFDQGYSVSKV